MKILALDDDREFLEELSKALSDRHSVEIVSTLSDLLRSLDVRVPDVLLLDMHMPDISGLQVLKLLRGSKQLDLPIVMLTGDSQTESVVSAIQSGATDYVTKESEDLLLNLEMRLSRISSLRELQRENATLLSKLAETEKSYEILGISAAVIKQRLEIQRFKGSRLSVLIEGENGTGKELVARNLNFQEGLGRPFVAVNCGALPSQLFESELFGHVKGSFTGAIGDQKGKFVAAQGGDIFFDEIGEMPLDMQVKLLRVLQEKVITPVGSVKTIPVQVRILSATNRNLEELVAQGKFRQDLFFRINQVTLKTSPLRERPEDIVYLAELFLARTKKGLHLSDEVKEALQNHTWPGNIRELQNTIDRASLFANDLLDMSGRRQIGVEHLSLSELRPNGSSGSPSSGLPKGLFPVRAEDVTRERFQRCVDWAQRKFLESALELIKDNDCVIQKLEMSRSYFYQKKKELGVTMARGPQ